MPASLLLQKHWRSASAAQISLAQQQAKTSVSAFAAATQMYGSLIQNWVEGQPVVELEHYPSDDVVDMRHGSQFYYHSHRDAEQQHGHLHLFWHATATGSRRYLKPNKTRWHRTAPTHLFAIALDARGLPVTLFTVNQWVTDGHWFDAATTLACVDRFCMGRLKGYEESCLWLTQFVRLYRPLIHDLLIRRDRRLAQNLQQKSKPSLETALQNKRLEVLSAVPIDWLADMDALEAEAVRRS